MFMPIDSFSVVSIQYVTRGLRGCNSRQLSE